MTTANDWFSSKECADIQLQWEKHNEDIIGWEVSRPYMSGIYNAGPETVDRANILCKKLGN